MATYRISEVRDGARQEVGTVQAADETAAALAWARHLGGETIEAVHGSTYRAYRRLPDRTLNGVGNAYHVFGPVD